MDRETIVQTGISTSATGGRSLPRSWTCKVVSGADEGREVSLGARPVVVGADSACDLVLSDPAVSRRHAEISISAEGIKVPDMGSTNGTFYKSSRVKEAVLPAQANIKVGRTRLAISPVTRPTIEPSRRTRFGGLIGESLPMREIFAVLELASPTDATVLIEGESGTGKELAARAIHDHSSRAAESFVVVDCSATQEHLLDSQLYGHVRGAFTGAVSTRKGAFVEADGGTIFLDEIGELPQPSQAKLLRAIEAGTVQPLGSDRAKKVDTRIIAASHRDLAGMVERKKFRFDLLQRLAVVHVRIPPLNERTEDLPVLISHFYEGRGVEPGEIQGPWLQPWLQHDWPGNVRELRNALERAWVLGGSGDCTFSDLDPPVFNPAGSSPGGGIIDTGLPFKEAKERWIERFEKRYIAAVYEAESRNISRAATRAGINRNHFSKLLKKYGLT